MVVFGIDPGYAIVGWGAISFRANAYKALGFGSVETQAHTDFNQRLEYIYDELFAILKRCRPDALAIEKLYFQTNKTTAIKVAQARGVTLLAAQKLRIPIFEYTPLQVKTAVAGYAQTAVFIIIYFDTVIFLCILFSNFRTSIPGAVIYNNDF